VNTADYEKNLRPAMSVGELLEMFGGWPAHERAVPIVAEVFEEIPAEELVGVVVDAGEIAADLDQPAGVRRLEACVASVAESALGGLADWDAVCDLLEASNRNRREKR